MPKYYFTFSGIQKPFQHCYHVIEADDADKASEIMTERFNQRWARCYETPEEAGVTEFSLKEIPWPIEFQLPETKDDETKE